MSAWRLLGIVVALGAGMALFPELTACLAAAAGLIAACWAGGKILQARQEQRRIYERLTRDAAADRP